MALPPNETVKTSIEMTQKVIGINDVKDAAAATAQYANEIEAAKLELIQYAKAAEQAYEQTRKLAAAEGVSLPKFQQSFRQRVAIGFNQAGDANQFVEIEAKAGERSAAAIERTARARREMLALRARLSDNRLPTLENLLGGSPAAAAATQPLLDALTAGDAAAVANMRPLYNLILKNRRRLGRNLNVQTKGIESGYQRVAIQELEKGNIEGAIALLDEGREQQATSSRQNAAQSALFKTQREILPGLRSRVSNILESQQRRFGGLSADDLSRVSDLQNSIKNIEDATAEHPDKFKEDSVKIFLDEFENVAKPLERSALNADKASVALDKLEKKLISLGDAIDATTRDKLKADLSRARDEISPEGRERRRQVLSPTLKDKGYLLEAESTEALYKSIKEDIAPSVEKASEEVKKKTEEYRKEASATLRQYKKDVLFAKYGDTGAGAVASTRMMAAEIDAEDAEKRGAFAEAEMHRANAQAAYAELQAIDMKARNRGGGGAGGGYRSASSAIRGVNRVLGGITSTVASTISGDTSGLATGIIGMGGAGFQALQGITSYRLAHGIGNSLANLGLFGAAALGSLSVGAASATYGRGSAFLNRADASAANFLPTYEGFASANRGELMSSFPDQTMSDMLLTSIMQSKGYTDFEANRESTPGVMGFFSDVLDGVQAGASAAVKGLFGGGHSIVRDKERAVERLTTQPGFETLSEKEQASLAHQIRQRVQNQVFENFGPGKGNVTLSQIGEAISASGRGFGTEFNVGVRPEGMTEEMFGAGSAAAYANLRGLSVASIARLSSLSPRFGVTNYSEVPGLVGVGGFGFRAGARDAFIDTINERVSQAALGGETPELAMRNRLYQGAVNAGGNKEQLANLYAGSIGNMGDLRRGMFKGAADFSKKLMMLKAVSTGGSLFAADDLLAEQGPGFTEMDRLRDAMSVSPFMAEAEMRFEGVGRKTREALMTSMASGGGDVKEEPVTAESYFNKLAESFASQKESEEERSLFQKSDMGIISSRFDAATSRFANAVQRFTIGIMR